VIVKGACVRDYCLLLAFIFKKSFKISIRTFKKIRNVIYEGKWKPSFSLSFVKSNVERDGRGMSSIS
jgi:hypothetical protein